MIIYQCGCEANGCNVASFCPMHGDPIRQEAAAPPRKPKRLYQVTATVTTFFVSVYHDDDLTARRAIEAEVHDGMVDSIDVELCISIRDDLRAEFADCLPYGLERDDPKLTVAEWAARTRAWLDGERAKALSAKEGETDRA